MSEARFAAPDSSSRGDQSGKDGSSRSVEPDPATPDRQPAQPPGIPVPGVCEHGVPGCTRCGG